MPLYGATVLEHLCGAISCTVWVFVLASQVLYDWRRKSSEGCSASIPLVWFASCILQCPYYTALKLSVALILQPHIIALLSLVCIVQYFYHRPDFLGGVFTTLNRCRDATREPIKAATPFHPSDSSSDCTLASKKTASSTLTYNPIMFSKSTAFQETAGKHAAAADALPKLDEQAPRNEANASGTARCKGKWIESLIIVLVLGSAWAAVEWLLFSTLSTTHGEARQSLLLSVSILAAILATIVYIPFMVECVRTKSADSLSGAWLWLHMFGSATGVLSVVFKDGQFDIIPALCFLVVGGCALILYSLHLVFVLRQKHLLPTRAKGGSPGAADQALMIPAYRSNRFDPKPFPVDVDIEPGTPSFTAATSTTFDPKSLASGTSFSTESFAAAPSFKTYAKQGATSDAGCQSGVKSFASETSFATDAQQCAAGASSRVDVNTLAASTSFKSDTTSSAGGTSFVTDVELLTVGMCRPPVITPCPPPTNMSFSAAPPSPSKTLTALRITPQNSPSPLRPRSLSPHPSPFNPPSQPTYPSPFKSTSASKYPSPLKSGSTSSYPSPMHSHSTSKYPSPLKSSSASSYPSPLHSHSTPKYPSPLHSRSTSKSPRPLKARSPSAPLAVLTVSTSDSPIHRSTGVSKSTVIHYDVQKDVELLAELGVDDASSRAESSRIDTRSMLYRLDSDEDPGQPMDCMVVVDPDDRKQIEFERAMCLL